MKSESSLKELRKDELIKYCLAVQNNYEGVVNENAILKKQINDLCTKFTSLEAEVEVLKNTKKSEGHIGLQKLIFENQQYSRRDSLEIFGMDIVRLVITSLKQM